MTATGGGAKDKQMGQFRYRPMTEASVMGWRKRDFFLTSLPEVVRKLELLLLRLLLPSLIIILIEA